MGRQPGPVAELASPPEQQPERGREGGAVAGEELGVGADVETDAGAAGGVDGVAGDGVAGGSGERDHGLGAEPQAERAEEVDAGEDDKVDVPLRRDARVAGKAAKLARRVGELFPELPLRVAFSWAGTFAETDDGLPFFGPHEQHGPRVHFAMAYGGNGITYSLIGAEMLRDTLLGKKHPCSALFGFDRLKRNR